MNKVIIVDKNKKLIEALKEANILNVKVVHGDVFEEAKKMDALIATASNPMFSMAGTLQADYFKGDRTGGYVIKEKSVAPVLTPDREEKRQNGRRFKENGEPSFTLTGQDIHGITDGIRIRKLTPTECERLQSFSDGWTNGISDTQRYKVLGNAVTTNVVTAIGERLK